MRLVSLRDNQSEIAEYAILIKERTALPPPAAELSEKMWDNAHEIFLCHIDRPVGFIELILEEVCFPDEDLPQECVKIADFYFNPAVTREQKEGFYKLIRDWGRNRKAAMIEIELDPNENEAISFFLSEGLELAGAGVKNCYRGFI